MLRLEVPPPGSLMPPPASVSQSLSVHTLNDIPLIVVCSDPRVQVGPVGTGRQEELSFVRRVSIEMKLAPSIAKSFDAVLLVSSPKFPAFSLHLPVQVEVANPEVTTLPK